MDGALLSPEDTTEYRSIVGGLQYLLHDQTSLMLLIVSVSISIHLGILWTAVKRILRYIRHRPCYGLRLRSASSGLLSAFSDAD
jgi:hypothetical protein